MDPQLLLYIKWYKNVFFFQEKRLWYYDNKLEIFLLSPFFKQIGCWKRETKKSSKQTWKLLDYSLYMLQVECKIHWNSKTICLSKTYPCYPCQYVSVINCCRKKFVWRIAMYMYNLTILITLCDCDKPVWCHIPVHTVLIMIMYVCKQLTLDLKLISKNYI